MSFREFVDLAVERLARRADGEPAGTYFALHELVADLEVPSEWAEQVAKLLEYRLLADCLYSSHGTPYVRPATGRAPGHSISVA
jgi:hypothetical protein